MTVDHVAELESVLRCHCDPAWTERKLHAPDCLDDYLEDVHEAVAVAERRGYQRGIGALRDERRRIVAALTAGIETWERTALSLAVVGTADTGVVVSAVAEMRRLLTEVGCTCPQVETTTLGDAEPRYTRGRDELCVVHHP